VVERLCVGNRWLNTLIYPWTLILDDLRQGGAIKGISGTLRREGWGECCGYSEVFYVVAPPVLVKDRWVSTREQVLNVSITYRWYGLGKPSSLLLIDVLAFSTGSLVGSREKLGTDLRIGQPACCRLCRELFFSGAVTLSNSIDDSWKVATYGDRPQKVYTGHTWTGVGSIHVVLVGFSPAGCTSIWIIATLRYE
jgi:hypothetical protein